ncbi:MAG: nucleotidyltransferase family protein [Rhodospirillales bacterium]|nr:nucleotidyltransferase family protein [Rhodospirillales bacterium]
MSVSTKSPANPAGAVTGSVEFELLCRIARPRPDLARVRELLHAGVDYPDLIELASEHGVRPQLIGGLQSLSWEAVPAAARDSLEDFQRFHFARTLSLTEELCRVAAAFAAKGLRLAAFKGPALAVALYGDVSRREYLDLDILVSEPEVDQSERLLDSLGYRGDAGDRAFRRAFLGYLRQCAFVHPGIDAAIDLHWDFSGVHVPFPLTPAEVWRDLAQVSIGDRTIPTVSGPNLALLLAGHGTKEAWRCLGWVCDFALLLDRHPEFDWRGIHRRARARGCGDAILLGCAMALELLEVPVPPVLEAPIAASARVGALTAVLSRELRQGLPLPAPERHFSDFHLCDSRLDKLKAVMRLVLTRTTGDYEAMKLPQALWSVYYVTRPFRLAVKALAALR